MSKAIKQMDSEKIYVLKPQFSPFIFLLYRRTKLWPAITEELGRYWKLVSQLVARWQILQIEIWLSTSESDPRSCEVT